MVAMKLIGAIFALCILTVTGNSSFSLSRKLLSSSKEGDDDKLSRKLQVLKVRGGSAPTDWASIMDWRFFLAGGACAAFSHGITTPIGPNLYNSSNRKHSSTFIIVVIAP